MEVVRNIRSASEDIKPTLPQGYDVRIVRDLSTFIEAHDHDVEEHRCRLDSRGTVVLLFLANFTDDHRGHLPFPTSIIATFGLKSGTWTSRLNMLTLLALTLSVGIVIDDAIVVLENIYRFIEEKHEDKFKAAKMPPREIGLAVLATTLSLVAIFVPVGFMGGMVGRSMKSFGLTMAFAIAWCRWLSATLTPMLSARWLKVDAARTLNGCSHGSSLRHRSMVDGPPLDRCGHRAARVPRAYRCSSMVPRARDDQSSFEISLRAPGGTSLEATEVRPTVSPTRSRRRFPRSTALTSVGGDQSGAQSVVHLRASGADQARKRDQFVIMDAIRGTSSRSPARTCTSVSVVRAIVALRGAERRDSVPHQRTLTCANSTSSASNCSTA